MKHPIEDDLRVQANKSGFTKTLTAELVEAAAEVAAHFEHHAPGLDLDFELCDEGVIMTCIETCLGLTGTIKKDGSVTFTFPAGENLEQVVLTESAFQSRKPVLDGATRYANSKS